METSMASVKGMLPALGLLLQETEAQQPVDDTWVKVVSGVLALVIVAIIILRRKKRKKPEEEF